MDNQTENQDTDLWQQVMEGSLCDPNCTLCGQPRMQCGSYLSDMRTMEYKPIYTCSNIKCRGRFFSWSDDLSYRGECQ